MKKLILISIISLLVLSPIFVSAQTDLATMKPGITPDSPFYFLDKWGEKINLFFIFSSETKAEKALQFAEERIAEVKSMAEKNNVGAMQSADNNYQELIALANQKTQEAKDNGKNVEELASLITEKTLNHQEILAQVFEKVPEEAKVVIEQAIKSSRNGSEEAVKAVSGDKKDELLQKMEDVKSKITEKFAALEEKITALEQKIEEKNTNKEVKKEIKNEEKVNGNQPQISQQNQQEQNTTNHSPQNTLNQIQQNTQQIIQNTNQITQNTQQIIQNTTPPACYPDWECNSWNTCINSQQIRVCSDLNNCGVATGKPSEIKSCVVVCTPNWQCTDWNICSNSTQTRTCSDSNNCGVTMGKPSEIKSCVVICTPDWSCDAWGSCINFQQSRVCTDSNSCSTTTGKPSGTQACQDKSLLEIFNPIPSKGIIKDRIYYAYDWDTFNNNNIPDSERPAGFIFPNESNYIVLGVIVRDAIGQSVKDATLKAEATDASQNKTINGTGMIQKMYDANGNPSEIVSYYGYYYEFKSSGEHTITFSAYGMTKSVTINVK